MSFLPDTPIQEPRPVLRRASTPLSPLSDPEKQETGRSVNSLGFRRRSSTLSNQMCPDSQPRRRDTLLSTESFIQKPERSPTVVVEDEALHGYPKLASFLGGQDGYAIYRRFAFLNARNLLYHQAKLVRLEHELNEIEQSFAHREDLHYKVHHVFDSESGSPGYQLRVKYEQVSRALDKYNKLLLEQKKLHELPSPDSTFVESIHNFIKSDKPGRPDWLEHPEDTIYAVWDDDRMPVQKDLIALNPDFGTQDPFTRFFTTAFLDWWHKIYARFKKPDGDLDEHVYQDKTLSRYIGAITMIIASALPTSSIVALYFIQSAIWRLVFIVLFSGVFASSLAFFTNARRAEVFIASVSLASVQVVFVGTAFSGAGGVSN